MDFLRVLVFSCFLCFSAPFCMAQDSQPPSLYSAQDIEDLKQVFVSILTTANASQEDVKKLTSWFDDLKSNYEELPTKLEKASQLSKENERLKIAVGILGVVTVLALVF